MCEVAARTGIDPAALFAMDLGLFATLVDAVKGLT